MSKIFREYYESDLYRYHGICSCYMKSFLYLWRKAQTEQNFLLKKFYKFGQKLVREIHGLEIGCEVNIGKGLYIGHHYNITINPNVIIGENCSIHKGVTIGQENRGMRKGAPIIGDMVWIGVNATIVGRIQIGNDVLIAPNSYVNCDIPDHSVVYGNPCVIKHRENATEGYINNIVD